MPTDTLAPASSPSGLDQFLSTTLASMKPDETTSPAPANTNGPPESSAAPQAAAPTAPVAPSGDTKPADAAEKPVDMREVMRQLSDQTKANKKLGKNNIALLEQVKSLKSELQELRSKVDGTYTEPAGPTPEQERAMMDYQAREVASRKVADDKYGADIVQAKIFAEDSPYRELISEHPWVHARVMGSEMPILEALTALDEMEVLTKFGNTPQSVLDNVTKAVKDNLWKEWTQQMANGQIEKPGAPVATLGDTRGDTTRQDQSREAPAFSVSGFNRHIA